MEWKRQVEIAKLDEDQHLVFGWLSVTKNADGSPLVDLQGDTIAPDTIEKTAYDFVLHSRVGGREHQEVGVSTLVESICFSAEKLAAFGLPANATFKSGDREYQLAGAWWCGWHVEDPQVWKDVKAGKYRSFSIGGTADRVGA